MSPLMTKLLSEADFAQADVTYKASIEFEYLFNMVVFNYTTLRCKLLNLTLGNNDIQCALSLNTGHVVARVRLDCLTAEAYMHCFKSIFTTTSKDHSSFAVGSSLIGLVVDWSDTQMKGLEMAVGTETAAQIAKGCRVHFTRSVKRVSDRVNKNNNLAHKAFTTIAYQIPHVSAEDEVLTLFDVLSGKTDISHAIPLCQETNALQQYAPSHNPSKWKELEHWAEWWKRPKHLRK